MNRRLVALLGLLAFGCAAEATPPPPVESAPIAPPPECSGTGQPCERFGLTGECVQSRCVLAGGRCSQESDCADGEGCTTERCEAGRCVSAERSGRCANGEGTAGSCVLGLCEVDLPASCGGQQSCPRAANGCMETSCVELACSVRAKAEGEACQSAIGREGSCAGGRCVPVETPEERCKTIFQPGYGYVRSCTKGLAFVLEPAAIAAVEQAITQELARSYRYDVKVALVGLPDGGYNLVLLNRQPFTDLHGLLDPSFVAWSIADYTRATSWKSRNLHIWLQPYEQGWGLSTAGGREAVDVGRAASGLGFLGVMNAPAFRKWLERSFHPLQAADASPPAARQKVGGPG